MLKLDLPPSFDFDLIGIVSAARGFKLAWLMNQTLGISLRRVADMALDFSNGDRADFALFQYLTENDTYMLLRNRAVDGVPQKPLLVPELPNFDYLLKINNQTGAIDVQALEAKIAALDAVQYCALLNPEELKSRENLLF